MLMAGDMPRPDGATLLASTGHDGTIRLWNPVAGQPVGSPLTGHTSGIRALTTVLGPDGTRLLASTGDDGTIRIWDIVSGRVTMLFGDVGTLGFSDRRARVDSLDRAAIATVIGTLLTDSGESVRGTDGDLSGPTVVSIEGPWGSGKTSLLGFVHDPLVRPGPPEDRRPLTVSQAYRVLRDASHLSQAAGTPDPGDGRLTGVTWVPVWFNPWAHQSSDEVWAGLARAILDAVDGVLHRSARERERYWLVCNAQRLDGQAIRRTLWKRSMSPCFRLAVWAALAPVAVRLADPNTQLYLFQNKVFSAATLALLLPIGLLVAAITHTGYRYLRAPAAAYLPLDLLRGPVLSGVLAQMGVDQPEPLRDPLYHARSGYLYLYQHDVKKLLDDAGRRGYRLVVFIDDLDRCAPEATAHVLGAINLFLSEHFPHSRFVLGLDPVVVAAHIDQIYRDLPETNLIAHQDDPSPGWTFLRKLVQLPVPLPYITDPAVNRLLATELGDVLTPPSATATPTSERPVPRDGIGDLSRPKSIAKPGTLSPPTAGPFDALSDEQIEEVPHGASALPPAEVAAALERSPQVRELLTERLLAQRNRSARETKRLVTVWQFYVRLVSLIDPIAPSAAEERARHLVLLAEVITRWPALQRNINRRVGGIHGLTLLNAAAPDDIEWARAVRALGLEQASSVHACRNLRDLLTTYDVKPVAELAARLM